MASVVLTPNVRDDAGDVGVGDDLALHRPVVVALFRVCTTVLSYEQLS